MPLKIKIQEINRTYQSIQSHLKRGYPFTFMFQLLFNRSLVERHGISKLGQVQSQVREYVIGSTGPSSAIGIANDKGVFSLLFYGDLFPADKRSSGYVCLHESLIIVTHVRLLFYRPICMALLIVCIANPSTTNLLPATFCLRKRSSRFAPFLTECTPSITHADVSHPRPVAQNAFSS